MEQQQDEHACQDRHVSELARERARLQCLLLVKTLRKGGMAVATGGEAEEHHMSSFGEAGQRWQ